MLSKLTRVAVGAAVALLVALPALAGGFQVQQQGAKASGRGNAFTAQADDASAVYYNPAGAAQLDGWQIYLGGTALFQGDTTFTPPGGADVEMQSVNDYPAEIYVIGRLTEAYSIAFGANVPYALRSHWFASDPVANSALKTRWTSRDYNFSWVVKIGDEWGIAVGVDWIKLEIQDFSSAYDFTFLSISLVTPPPFSAHRNYILDGDKAGYNLALHYKSENGYRFGVSYRSQRIVRMKGHEEWADVSQDTFGAGTVLIDPSGCPPGPALCPMEAAFTSSVARSTIVIPATLQVGFAQVGLGNWDWEVDLLYSRWSNFDSIDISVDDINGEVRGLGAIVVTTFDLNQNENWSDTVSLFVGAEYHASDAHAIRFGVALDPTPVRESLTRPYNPDADRLGLTAGYGWSGSGGRFVLDLFGQYWIYDDVNATSSAERVVRGTYDTTEYALGASFQFQF